MADVFSKAKRSQIMSNIKGKDTSPELVMTRILKKLRLKVQRHSLALPGSPDIVLPKYKTIIFINGCFWHGHNNCPRAKLPKTNHSFWKAKVEGNMRRDNRQRKQLRREGWKVLTFWTCKSINRQLIVARLKRVKIF